MKVTKEGRKTIYKCGKKQEEQKQDPVVKNKKIKKNEAVPASRPEEVNDG